MIEPTATPDDEIQFASPDQMIHRAQACIAKLDAAKSGEQSRELHDFLQDEFMPLFASAIDQVAKLTIVAMQHENRIVLIEESDLVQLDPELVGALLEHLEKVGALLEGLEKTAPMPQIAALLKDNKEFVEQLHEELTGEEDDDEEKDGRK